MSLLKNFAILLSINIILVLICLTSIYYIGQRLNGFSTPLLLSILIFFLLVQLYSTFRVLKTRRIFTIPTYAICIVGIIAIWGYLIFFGNIKLMC
jgi:predicted PurR-regulated permease PerM